MKEPIDAPRTNRRYLRVGVWIAAAFIALLAACGGGGPEEKVMPYVQIEYGNGYAYMLDQPALPPLFLVVQDAPSWAAFWVKYKQDPGQPLPSVDFAQTTVAVLISNGFNSAPCGGGLEVSGVVRQHLRTVVQYTAVPPLPPGISCPAVVNIPTQIISFDRAEGVVDFVEVRAP